MSVRWLSFQSFQYSQELISSINTLLIYLKLKESGTSNETREEKAKQSYLNITTFLESFEKVVSELESGTANPTLGTDVRFRQLAKSFIKATNNHRRFKSILFQNNIAKFRDLLAQKNDDPELITSLEELRLLIEEHLYDDMEQVLGEV